MLNYISFYRRFRYCLALDYGLIWITWMTALFSLILIGTLAIQFNPSIRFLLILLFTLLTAFFSAKIIFQCKKNASVKAFCQTMAGRSKKFKDLEDALELSKTKTHEGISQALCDQFIQEMQKKLDQYSPKQFIHIPYLKKKLQFFIVSLLVLFSLFLTPPNIAVHGFQRLFYGSHIELSRYVKINPEGASVIYGDPAVIEVELIETKEPEPKLLIKNSLGWEELPVEQQLPAAGIKFLYHLNSVTEKISYKVKWKNLESRHYELIPVNPPQLTDIIFKITYPEYTGLNPETLHNEQILHVFRGSMVEMSAQSTQPLKKIEMVSSLGIRSPVQLIKNQNIQVQFKVHNPFEFWFEMQDEKNLTPARPVHYITAIRQDSPPQIRLLAPAADITAAKDSKIPFTFEVKDDIAVTRLYLKAENQSVGARERFHLKNFSAGTREKIDSADFSLSALQAGSGDVLKIQLEVQDNDTVTGPKSGFSESILIEIQSFEKEHQKIENELKDFRDHLLRLLADQTEAKMQLEAIAKLPDRNEKILQAMQKQSEIIAKTEKLEKQLEQTLDKMEQDPLSDFSLIAEHQFIKESLKNVHEESMRRAEQNLAEGNIETAQQEQESAVAELERLSSLSEEVYKRGKMQSLLHAADRLNEKGEQLSQRLESGAQPNSRELQMLQDILKETMDVLAQMERQIKDLPQELPDDFINQPAVKNVNLNEIEQTARQLSQALQKGDLQSAIQAAKKMLEQVKTARQTLAKAAESSTPWESTQWSQQLDEKQNRLNQMIEKQENLLQKTSQFESKRIQADMDLQKRTLSELARRQKQAIIRTNDLTAELEEMQSPPTFIFQVIDTLNSIVPKMQKVMAELEQSNVLFSQKWLDEIVRSLNAGSRPIASAMLAQISTDAAHQDLWLKDLDEKYSGIQDEEQSILETLRKPPQVPNPFTSQDLSALKQLSKEQQGISEDTQKLRSELNQLGNKTALVGPEILNALKGAHTEMRQAGQFLGDGKTEPAQESEQKALSLLRQSQQAMENSEQHLGEMKGAAKAGPSPILQSRKRTGGMTGFKTGVVKIPRADDYLPSRQFREELLESLKERYPKSEEESIKDYYKRLSR